MRYHNVQITVKLVRVTNVRLDVLKRQYNWCTFKCCVYCEFKFNALPITIIIA